MKRHKRIIVALIVVFVIVLGMFFLGSAVINKDSSSFVSSDPAKSNFATGGEIDNSRKYDSFGSTVGYTPLILDINACPPGRDTVYFGLGHTEFLVEEVADSYCIFSYGTEIENPRWDGKLTTRCKVPKSTKVKLTVNNQGIGFSPLDQYCSGN